MPGVCRKCGEPVHRKTAGGKWYRVCDGCRNTEPPTDSLAKEDVMPIDDLPPMPPMPEPPESDDIRLPARPRDPGVPPGAPPAGYGPGTATGGPSERDSRETKHAYRTDVPPDGEVDLTREPF
jgi:hypothetical protein